MTILQPGVTLAKSGGPFDDPRSVPFWSPIKPEPPGPTVFDFLVKQSEDSILAREQARENIRSRKEEALRSPAGRADAAAAFEAEIIDLDDLEDPEPVIEGFLYRDTLVRTFGPPKSLKSFVTLDMAACVSLGRDWQGHPTHRTVVLYVVAEGARGVKKRRAAWNEHHGAEMEVIFYPKPVQIGDQTQMHRLISFCIIKQVGYVIFDTQARCTVGVNENDNTEMGEIVAALDVLKQQTGACVHLVHHSTGSDADKARGATAWDGAVDAEFRTKRKESEVDLITKFQKDIGEADDVLLETREVAASLVLSPRGLGTGSGGGAVQPALVTEANAFYLRAVREFGDQPVTITDIEREFKAKGIKKTRNSIKKAYGVLLAGGALVQTGTGTAVKITQGGMAYLDLHPEQADSQGVIPGVMRHPHDT